MALPLPRATAAIGQRDTSSRAEIVFVCEHGAAKSVIAAAYFNKLAAEKVLRERAIYRGASPQAELSAATLNPITSDDVTSATHIFAIGCSLPAHASSSGKADSWDDVPEVTDGYAASRDAIKRYVERLINQLQQR
jgi:protein-tyrosine-phosphatase